MCVVGCADKTYFADLVKIIVIVYVHNTGQRTQQMMSHQQVPPPVPHQSLSTGTYTLKNFSCAIHFSYTMLSSQLMCCCFYYLSIRSDLK